MTKLVDSLRFLLKDLIRDGWRTLITVVNLLVFICIYFALAAFAEATYKFGNQPTDRSALILISRNVFDPSESVVTNEDFVPAQELIPMYVSSVSPLIFKIIQVNGNLMQLRAARLEDMEEIHSLQLIEGFWPLRDDQVVIGEGTAVISNWNIGDVLHIYGSDFAISGIVRAPGTKYSSIWMTLDTATHLFDSVGKYQFAWIRVPTGVDVEQVRAMLQADPRLATRFDVYLADNLYQEYSKAVSDLKNVSGMLVILALLAVMLGTYCNIFLVLTERKKEITILRAVGYQSGTIRSLITIRTLLQVCFGYLISWGFITLLLNRFNQVNPLSLHSIPLPVSISSTTFLIGLVLSLLFAWIGVWLPTRQLLTQSVAHSINL